MLAGDFPRPIHRAGAHRAAASASARFQPPGRLPGKRFARRSMRGRCRKCCAARAGSIRKGSWSESSGRNQRRPSRASVIPAAPGRNSVALGPVYARQAGADDDASVAIVGTRRATPYGRQAAERIAAELAQAGVTVVSGLARGVDAAAHRAALAAGGRTIAVLGSGPDVIYPAEHAAWRNRSSSAGAIIRSSRRARNRTPRISRLGTGSSPG